MARDQDAGTAVVAAPETPLRAPHSVDAARRAAALVIAAALAATLVFLYYGTQSGDFKVQNEILVHLRELKEIDARWDVEVLRARTDTASAQAGAAGADHGAQLARIRSALNAAANTVESPVLEASLPELNGAFSEKAQLIARFKKANAAAREALGRVLAAKGEFAGLMRGAWQSYSDHERLIAVENVVTHMLAEAQEYYFTPGERQRKSVEALRRDLRDGITRLPLALQAGIARLDANVETLLDAKPLEVELGTKIAFRTAGPRVDTVTAGYSRELEQALSSSELYRVYLIAYAASLLVLIGYLGSRLLRSYRLLNRANLALKSANEGLEQRVEERTRDLSDALTQLKESEAQLVQSEKMSSLGQMVAGVAHEINTPLAYVKSSLGSVKKNLPQLTLLTAEAEKLLVVLQSGASDPHALSRQFALVQTLLKQIRQHQVLDELQALVGDGLYGIGEISEIVLNLKNFSRLDRSRVSAHNLNEAIDSTLLLAKHELKHVVVKKQLAEIPAITCSPSQINQVLLNIINNAAQAVAPDQGVIRITTRTAGPDRVAVDVEDNGNGIAPDVMPKIFDPFFTTKKVGQGTGLGLSIAYKIVKQHGGDIAVQSSPGAGTRFTVVLPLALPDADRGSAEPASMAAQAL